MVMPFNPQGTLEAVHCHYSYFKGEDSEAQRGEGPAQGHTATSWGLGFEPRILSHLTLLCLSIFISVHI